MGTTSTTENYTITYFCGDCPFRGRCTDNGTKCETCVNNPKRSYYEPIPSPAPYVPYIPYIPWTPWPIPFWQPWPQPYYVGDPPLWCQPTITCQTTTITSPENT